MSQFEEFERDSLHWHARILKGTYAHWCPDWDDLPIDETCTEFTACACHSSSEASALKEALRKELDEAFERLQHDHAPDDLV